MSGTSPTPRKQPPNWARLSDSSPRSPATGGWRRPVPTFGINSSDSNSPPSKRSDATMPVSYRTGVPGHYWPGTPVVLSLDTGGVMDPDELLKLLDLNAKPAPVPTET